MFLDILFEHVERGQGLFHAVNVMVPKNLKEAKTLSTVAAFAPKDLNIDLFDSDTELQLLQSDKNVDFHMDILQFYCKVNGIKQGSNVPVYKNIMQVMRFLSILPYSTVLVIHLTIHTRWLVKLMKNISYLLKLRKVSVSTERFLFLQVP